MSTATCSRAIISGWKADRARGPGSIARALQRDRAAALVSARLVRVSTCPSVFRTRTAAARQNRRKPTGSGLCRACRHHQFLLFARRLASGRAGRAAKHLGLAGLGIADRNSVAGVVRAHVIPRKNERCAAQFRHGTNDPELKLAVGARLVFADGTPDILAYPQDRAAWGRLTRLLTLGKRRAEKGECILCVAGSPRLYRRPQSHRHAAARGSSERSFADAA